MALQEPQRREVEHAVGAVKRAVQNVRLQDVAACLVDADTRVAQRCLDVGGRAPDEIVIDDDLADVVFQKLVDRVRADQARAPDDHQLGAPDVHVIPTLASPHFRVLSGRLGRLCRGQHSEHEGQFSLVAEQHEEGDDPKPHDPAGKHDQFMRCGRGALQGEATE